MTTINRTEENIQIKAKLFVYLKMLLIQQFSLSYIDQQD